LAGGSVGVGVDEAAGGGIVVAGLEIIQSGLIGVGVAMRAKKGWFQSSGNGTKNRIIR